MGSASKKVRKQALKGAIIGLIAGMMGGVMAAPLASSFLIDSIGKTATEGVLWAIMFGCALLFALIGAIFGHARSKHGSKEERADTAKNNTTTEP